MTPLNRVQSEMEKLETEGCATNSNVRVFIQEYGKQADKADQQLEAKQAQEQQNRQLGSKQ
jgi:hypothetical protein